MAERTTEEKRKAADVVSRMMDRRKQMFLLAIEPMRPAELARALREELSSSKKFQLGMALIRQAFHEAECSCGEEESGVDSSSFDDDEGDEDNG